MSWRTNSPRGPERRSRRERNDHPCSSLCFCLGLCCVAGILLACTPGNPPLNVLLITLDTTRADRLGVYGNAEIETPAIDGLASEGFLYERCYTPVPITLPSHLSIHTGTFPPFHGVRENGGFYVAPELTTLAEVLSQEGYATAAFVGAYPLDSQTGIDQGFDLYDDNYPSSLEAGKHPALRGFFDERPAAEVIRPAMEWLDRQSSTGKQPFFLWTHFFDPHQPQIPPSPFRERYAHNLYDGEIASVDDALSRLLTRLQALDLLDNTLVVLTADHGESLGEHGELTHALLLYSSTVRVPLIVRDPRNPVARRIDSPVSTVDIVPTVLDRLGLETPSAVQGRILPKDNGVPGAQRRALYSETLYGALLHGWSPLERLTTADWLLVQAPQPRLYDLRRDPAELHDLADRESQQVAILQAVLAEKKASLSVDSVDAAAQSISPEQVARLAALGYLGGGGQVSIEDLSTAEGLPDPHDAIDVFRDLNVGKQLSEREPAMAAAVLEHAKRRDPTNPYLVFHLALSYYRLDDRAALQRELDHLLNVAPDLASGYLLLAEMHSLDGDLPAAVGALERALELDPGNQATQLLLAHRLEDAGRLADARMQYQKLIDQDDEPTGVRNGYATLLYRAGEVERARQELELLVTEQPFYAPAHLNLAVVTLDASEYERSTRHARRALELRPTYGLAHELVALTLEAQGEAAEEAWQLARHYALTAEARRRAEQALGLAGSKAGVARARDED